MTDHVGKYYYFVYIYVLGILLFLPSCYLPFDYYIPVLLIKLAFCSLVKVAHGQSKLSIPAALCVSASLCLRLTSDDQSVWDSRLIEHTLDVVVVECERLSFPTLRVHQQHHPAWTRQFTHRHPYRERRGKIMGDCNETIRTNA